MLPTLFHRLFKQFAIRFQGIVFIIPTIHFLLFYKRYLKEKNGAVFPYPTNRSIAYRSNGKSLDWGHRLATRIYPRIDTRVLGEDKWFKLDEKDFIQAQRSLSDLGFWICPTRVPDAPLKEFYDSARKRLLFSRSVDATEDPIEEIAKSWNEDMVNLDTQWVTEQRLALDLASSPSVLRIASDYIGAEPRLSFPESWFSFPVQTVKKTSAKNWHWDCDGIKWLKVFVYINDVSSLNGPHAFVATSHRNWKTNNKSSRVLDDEIVQIYGRDRVQIFEALKGAVIFEDTRGFHRGTPLLEGHRLVLQIQFHLDGFGIGRPQVQLTREYEDRFARTPRVLDLLRGPMQ